MFWYIYGDNVFSARKKLNEVVAEENSKNPGLRFVKIYKKGFDENDLRRIAENPSLFGQKNSFIIEEFNSFTPKQKKVIIDIFSHLEVSVIFWDSKETRLAAGLKKSFPKINVLNFPKPKIIFSFMETVFPGNQKQFLPLLAKIIKEQPLELVLYFLKQHFRTLVMFSIEKSLISNLPSWREKKLESQCAKFNGKGLENLYKNLIDIEYQNKSGALPVGLEIALVNLLATV